MRQQTLTSIYRDSALFRELRNSENLLGKCKVCEFKEICGGSRARAYAINGDVHASDPCCSYAPRQFGRNQETRGKVKVSEGVTVPDTAKTF